jgi:integral membrane protein (TIGR01906 family)
MRLARVATAVVLVLVIPIFLITSNVRWVINAPFLYSYGFDHYRIPERTGIERAELLKAGRQLRDYLNNGEEFVDVRVAVGGVTRSLYNEREVLHMRDVKGLVQGVYWIQVACAAFIGLFIVAGLVHARRRFLPHLARYVAIGGILTVVLVALVALASLAGFDRLFLTFHQVGFSNDLWQLDPTRDYLLMMFPEGFFFDATMWIAGSTVVEGIILAMAPFAFRRFRRLAFGRDVLGEEPKPAAG